MARVEAITSEDLVYQVTLTGLTRGRDTTGPVWTGIVPPARPGDPPTPFQPRGVDKVRSPAIEFVNPDIRFTAANGRLNYAYGLICYDFRTNNEERLDTSGRPEQRMNNVKRIQSAQLTFQVNAIAARLSVFYIACLPKINLARGPLPTATELGMNYFLGYNEVYRDPRGRFIGREGVGSGNVNPACLAGRGLDRDGVVEPIILRDSDRYPATVTVRLRSRMLRALERAMRNGDVFGLAAVPMQPFGVDANLYTPNFSRDYWDGTLRLPRDVLMGAKIRSGLNASFDPPKLVYRYTLDNNRINTGAGISRTSTSGFMTDNVFAGTNSGFSS